MKLLLVLTLCFVASRSLAQQSAQGLRGEYYRGINFKQKIGTRIDKEINFHWDQRHKPTPAIKLNNFSVLWRGQLYAPESGLYYFSSIADDAIQVWINGIKILDDKQQPKQGKMFDPNYLMKKRGSVNLQAKQWVPIEVHYSNGGGNSEVALYWELPSENQSPLGFQGIFRKIISAQNFRPVYKTNQSASLSMITNKHIVHEPNSSLKSKKQGSQFTPISSKPAVTITALPLELKLEKGKAVILHHVQFTQGSYVLMAESYPILNQLVALLKKWHLQRIQISGHTDNVGDARLNLTLSEYRAKQVANYLTQQGIATNRIETKGYGGKQPIANNSIEVERSKNRRVEVLLF